MVWDENVSCVVGGYRKRDVADGPHRWSGRLGSPIGRLGRDVLFSVGGGRRRFVGGGAELNEEEASTINHMPASCGCLGFCSCIASWDDCRSY